MILWLTAFLVGLAVMAAVNAYVDPLWLFSHEDVCNLRQWGFDERQQKTNRITFGAFDYDGLLLGSSRSTYIDQYAFRRHRVFNYAVNGMRPSEYADFLAYAEAKRGRPFEVVYLGLDFFATNLKNPSTAPAPRKYLNEVRRPLYRAESLLSVDTWLKSLHNARISRGDPCDCYDRHNVKHRPRPDAAAFSAALDQDIVAYRTHVYGPAYEYDAGLKATLLRLRRDHPHTRFVVFTTPISITLFEVLVDMGRLPDYQHWLRDIVDVFGEAWDFMGENTITADAHNYADAHHFLGSVGAIMVRRMEEASAASDPDDFGIHLTPANLEAHLAAQETLAKRLQLHHREPA